MVIGGSCQSRTKDCEEATVAHMEQAKITESSVHFFKIFELRVA